MIEEITEKLVDEDLGFIGEAVEKALFPEADAVSLIVEESADILSSLIEDIF